MCFAIPGKVVEINNEDVTVDYQIEKRKVKNFLQLKIGDYVIVQGGFVIKKIPEKEALEALELITEN
ncbi:HypC/HybG/HupF family hydrogenase formation chaperone [Candidatus Pacearchaeota archaeon]|nr:HypC/HybG/HupF family hydrogenase formation chaperone [Candidatus Pacearchaeota archaeon]MBD3283250.1 HypC/HybG/HupF family hydrogenase formation chaperone [Candidatus Pacearchaeota archaeon]